MPRQNTSPADFPSTVLRQIEQLAAAITATRKQRGESQVQWAEKLGISQPTMARLERGDPSVATATYVMCLWLINPALNLCSLLPDHAGAPASTGNGAAARARPRPSPRPAPRAPAATAAPAPTQPPASVADEMVALLASWGPPRL